MPDRIGRIALGLFTFTTVLFWLIAVRGAFDGPSYEWGFFRLRGQGVSGNYWFPLVGVSFALTVLAGGWRCRRWAFVVSAAWCVVLFAAVLVAVVSNPDDFRFRGDTFGVDVSLAWLGPALFGAGAALSLIAAWRLHRRAPAVAAWNRRNRWWALLLAGALPVQFALLRFGGEQSVPDQVGVIITIAQWLLVGRVFRPYPPSGHAT